MPEIPDVVTGETITTEWGNDIRDRVIQRYATAAARTASVPSPTEGDLSYLNDTNAVYVFTGAAWTPIADTLDGGVRAGAAQDSTPDSTITTTLTNKASVVFTKPAGWATYSIVAWGTATLIGGGASHVSARVSIGASNGTTSVVDIQNGTVPVNHSVATSSASPVTVAVAVAEVGGDATYDASTVQYIAYRLT